MTADRVERLPGSFRDPGGFLFRRNGVLYRQINEDSREDYGRLIESGLYETLTGAGLLVSHREVALSTADSPEACKVIEPDPVPFVSYPYEWCFSQLRDAALTTLAVQKAALSHNMALRDASAYNIQFRDGSPILIDTLSLGDYVEGEPWVAYNQFCRHFLAPLALMSYSDVRLAQLLQFTGSAIQLHQFPQARNLVRVQHPEDCLSSQCGDAA